MNNPNEIQYCYTFTCKSPGHDMKRRGKYWFSMKFTSDFCSKKKYIGRKFFCLINLFKGYLR